MKTDKRSNPSRNRSTPRCTYFLPGWRCRAPPRLQGHRRAAASAAAPLSARNIWTRSWCCSDGRSPLTRTRASAAVRSAHTQHRHNVRHGRRWTRRCSSGALFREHCGSSVNRHVRVQKHRLDRKHDVYLSTYLRSDDDVHNQQDAGCFM